MNAPKTTFTCRKDIRNTKRFLIKLGSSVVSQQDGHGVAVSRLASIIEQLGKCHSAKIECIIVSSGAVSYGKKIMYHEMKQKGEYIPKTLNIRQKRAAAAIGQPGLMALYTTLFSQYNINIAQILISNGSMSQSDSCSIIQSTVNELLSINIIPIINTNDAVNVPDLGQSDNKNEPQLCDNDLLAVALAKEINCDLVILATDVDGIYDRPPNHQEAKLISNFIPDQMQNVEFGGSSDIGTGGMASKVKAALYALSLGVSPVICNGNTNNFITSVLNGEEIGTFFHS